MTEQKPTADAMPMRKNAQGHLVPESLIDPLDLIRDELVQSVAAEARELRLQMVAIKAKFGQLIEDFIDLSANEYGVPYGGAKGNVTLTSFDGDVKLTRAVGEHRLFDERVQAAKQLIDQCIERWAEGSSGEIRALVEHAFRVNKQGRIDINQVLGLRKLTIDDPQWREAMQAIADAITVVGTTEYIRIYERVGTGAYRALPLDWAKL